MYSKFDLSKLVYFVMKLQAQQIIIYELNVARVAGVRDLALNSIILSPEFMIRFV